MRAEVLLRVMRSELHVARPGPASITGNSLPGTPTAFRGRVVQRERRVQGESGESVVSLAQVQTLERLAAGDWLWLPGEDAADIEQARRVRLVRNSSAILRGLVLYEAFL